jgi:hypothetical protein
MKTKNSRSEKFLAILGSILAVGSGVQPPTAQAIQRAAGGAVTISPAQAPAPVRPAVAAVESDFPNV